MMVLGTRRKIKKARELSVYAAGKEVQQVPSFKYLGFNLDQTLNFTTHISSVIQTVTHKLYVLGKLRKYMTTKVASDVYKTMVLPFFDYCDTIYAQAQSQCLDKLQRLQNRGIRLCLGLPPRSNVSLIHRTAKIPYLKDRRELHTITQMHCRKSCPDLVDNRESEHGLTMVYFSNYPNPA